MSEVQKSKNPWIRPWNMEKFDDLFNRDERYFSVLLKGALSWLNNHIVMYNKPINHFVFVTGSSYMYIESNGYSFSWSETSGEDWMYMQLPRCVVELNSIRIPTEELTSPFVRGNYERRDGNEIKGFNAQIRRLPVEMSLNLRYEFSTFNEQIIFVQEAIDKLLFQKYFSISYLGQIIKCSIEMPQDFTINMNQIDMTSTDPKQKQLELQVTINSNYPLIDETTEIGTDKVIMSFSNGNNFYSWTKDNPTTVKDADGNSIQVYYNSDGDIVTAITQEELNEILENQEGQQGNNVEYTILENGDVELVVSIKDLKDEFGETMTKKKLYESFNFNKIPNGSTLFAYDISNTTDIIDDVVYKK